MDVRVLLVDDQPRYMSALAAVVGETDGFTVVGQAATGEECLRLTTTVGVDLVLLDVNLPDIDGVEVARQEDRTTRPARNRGSTDCGSDPRGDSR